jgi:hypothetical protein
MVTKKTTTVAKPPVAAPVVPIAAPVAVAPASQFKGYLGVFDKAVSCSVCHDQSAIFSIAGRAVCYKDIVEMIKSGQLKLQVV